MISCQVFVSVLLSLLSGQSNGIKGIKYALCRSSHFPPKLKPIRGQVYDQLEHERVVIDMSEFDKLGAKGNSLTQ